MNSKGRKRIATIRAAAIAAAVQGLYRFSTREQTLAVLKRIRRCYLTAKRQEPITAESACPCVRIWIRGYAVSEAERERGYRGHYATIAICRREGGYSLAVEKNEIALSHHPERNCVKAKHPNLGHPTLREIRKGTVYPTFAEAYERLAALHREFPSTTIPRGNELLLLLYNRNVKEGPPIQRMVLKIKLLQKGGAMLEMQERVAANKKPLPPETTPRRSIPIPTEGTFVNRLSQRRRRPT